MLHRGRLRLWFLTCLIGIAVSPGLYAQERGGGLLPGQRIFQVGIDRDNNTATGCDFLMIDGNTVPGVDLILTIEVDASNLPVTVSGMTIATCNEAIDNFNLPVTFDPGGWPVGSDNGTAGTDVVEGFLPLSFLGQTQNSALVFQAISGTGNWDVVDGTQLVTFSLAIPTLTEWGLLALLLLLMLAGLWFMRRQRRIGRGGMVAMVFLSCMVVLALAGNFTADGNVDDWTGPSLASDPGNDSNMPGEPSVEITEVFAGYSDQNLFVRFDVADLELQPPVTAADNYNLNEGDTLNVPLANGVLNNDGDPNTLPLTALEFTPPQHGILTLQPDGSFSYVHDGGEEPTDSFVYEATNGISASQATVTLNIAQVNDPPTDIDLDNNLVDENQPVGTPIGTLTTVDVDPADFHTYTLVAGVGDTDNASFQILGDQLQTNAMLDFEAQENYSIRVQTDDGNGGIFAEQFTVTVRDINDGPTIIAIDNASVDENQPVGTLVGNLSTTDQDPGDTHIYSLVAGTGDTGNGFFQIVGAQLQTNAVFDFEALDNYSVRVRTDDQQTRAIFEQVFIITIVNGNDDPTGIALDNTAVDENQPIGTPVGNLSSTDQDVADTHTYTLVAGTGDTDNGSFQIVAGQLQTNAILDFEAQENYSVRVQTDDGNGGTFAQALAVTANNLNDDPTAIALDNNNVDENQPVGTLVGTLSSTDQDTADSHTYSLVAGAGDTDNASFQIVGDQIQTNAMLDFEAQENYSVRVQTDDGNGGTFAQALAISANDLNDDPTAVALDNATVDENQAVGTMVGNLSSTDQDPADTHTYSLVAGTGDADNGSFQIVGGQLQTNAVFDFESQFNFTVRVQTDDGNGGVFAQALAVTAANLNDDPTAIGLDNNNVDENQVVGTLVGNLSTTDQDVTDTHTYTLVAGTGDADNATFQIVGSQLQTNAVLDFEAQFNFTVRVQTDDGNGGTFAQAFAITANNINDDPTAIALDNNSVAENQPAATPVGNLSTTDQDTADTHTYTLVAGAGDTDNASFQIVGSQLQTAGSLDFEGTNPLSIRVRTDDGTGNFEMVFAISITDNNDAPTDIALDSTSIDEGLPVGSPVGNLSTTDQDTADTHTYSLVPGAGDSGNASFQIVGNQLRSNAVFDDAVQNSFSVRIRTDDGNGGTFEEVFTISIANTNDPPTDIALDNTSVNEGLAVGALVGNLSTTDPNPDTHVYTLVAGAGDTHNALFQIVGSQLQTNAVLDHETLDTFSVRIETDDQAGGTFEEAFMLTAVDVNEAPVFTAGGNQMVLEDAGAQTVPTWATGIGDGDDGSQMLTFNITGNTNMALFSAGPAIDASGTLTYTPAADANGSATITVQLMDDGGVANGGVNVSVTAMFDIDVTAVNDPPMVTGETFDGVSFARAIGNTVLEFANTSAVTTPRVFVSGDLLDNDTDVDSALSISVFDAASVQGGTVSVNGATGEFTYLPPAGYTGADSFTYTVTDGTTPVVGTVNITVGDMVWYIDNNAAAGDGRSSSPFNAMSAFNAVQGNGGGSDPEAGDTIFLHQSATTYADGITLLNNQHLIGEGRDLVVNSTTLVSATTNPSLTNASGDVVVLAADNIVEGLTLLPVASAGVLGQPEGMRAPEPAKFGTNTILRFLTINPAGTSDGIEFGLRSGTLTVQNTTIQGLAGATGIGILGSASGVTLDLDDVIIQSPLGIGMDLNNLTGAMTATNVAIATDGTALDIFGGTMTYSFDGTSNINQTTGGAAIAVTGVGGGALTFGGTSSISVSNLGAGTDAISVDAGGNAFTFTPRDFTMNSNTGDDAFVLANFGAGSVVNFAGSVFSILQAAGRGVALNAVEANLSFPVAANITSVVGTAFEIIGGAGNVAYPGSLGNGSGRVINIDGRTGGTVNFSNTVSEFFGGSGVRVANSAGSQTFADLDIGTMAQPLTADGILLTGNTGILNFTDLSVFTNSGRGIVASGGSPSLNINAGGGGTVAVSTTDALGLDIANAAMNANFGSVSVNNSVGGGINLNSNTGTTNIGLLSIGTTFGTGLTAINAGIVNVTDNTSFIISNVGPAMVVNPTTLGMSFATVTSTNSPTTGISLGGTSGTLTIAGGTISGSTGTAFDVNGGNSGISYGGNITNASGRIVSVINRSGGSVGLSGTLNGTGTGILMNNNTGGTTTLSGTTETLNTGANAAITLTANSGSTTNFTNGGLGVTTSGATGIDANNGGTVEILGSNNTISSTNGIAANLRGGTTIGGNGMTGGLNFLSISASGANNGIVLNGTGTGRFVVTGTGATDASGGTLQNINNNGIELISANNIIINNMDLLDANLTDGCGTEAYDELFGGNPGNQNCRGAIYMRTVTNPSFTNITIDDTAEHGINGVGVTRFQLINSEVLNAGNSIAESGILLRDLFGTVSGGTVNVISNTTVADAAQIGVFVRNLLRTNGFAGEPDRLELTNSQFLRSAATDSGDNVTISLRDDNPAGNGNGANFQTVVTGCTFTGRFGATNTTDQIQVDAGINAKSQVSITTSTFTVSNTGINISGADGSQTDFLVNANPNITVRNGTGVNVAVNGTASMTGTISNNPIIDSDQPGNPAFGVITLVDSNGSLVVDIDNNTITDFLLPVRAGARGGTGTANITLRNNDMTSSAVTGFGVVDILSGNGTVGESNSVCLNILNNEAFDPMLQGEYFLTQFPGTSFSLQGYGGAGNNQAAIEAFVDGNQVSGATTVCTVGFCGAGILSYTAAVCNTP